MDYDDLPVKTPPPSATGSSVTVAPPDDYDSLVPKTTLAPQPPAATGNSIWYDMFHPQAANLSRDQTWRDWATKTYSPTAKDFGSAALDDVSMGSADYLQAGYGGGNLADIRARTAASHKALGPMGPIVSAATYVAGPGKILGPLAAIGKGAKAGVTAGRAAIEGFGAGALSSEGHDLGSDKSFDQRAWDAAKQGTESAAFGVGGNLAGRGTARVFRPGFDAAQGAPGRASDPIFGETRKASARGEDIRHDMEWYQQQSGHDMSPVIDAAGIGTGPFANVIRKGANLVGRGAAAHVQPLTLLSREPGQISENIADWGMGKWRNYKTQGALDEAYGRVNPRFPLHADTSGWTNAIQQGMIGGSLP